ncbi:MAG: hypothetical protein H0T46_23415 [Deltaproteobacteria bacterium]|nr:hypothetical protein [Deltaproteobacteria bacterium]
MIRPLLLASSLLAACSTTGSGVGDPASCKIADVLEADLAGQSTKNCGSLGPQSTTAQFTAAKNCVLAAIESNEPFLVVWDIQGIDSRVARAFYGLTTEGGFKVSTVSYDGDPRGGGGENHPSTTTSSCASLASQADCGDDQLPTSLCLACAQPAVTDTCTTP